MNAYTENKNNNDNNCNNSNLSIKWTNRFIYAAIIQGAIIVGLTIFLFLVKYSF